MGKDRPSYGADLIRGFNREDEHPFASFIVPTLVRDSLRRTIGSLSDQTVDDWQAIMVIDWQARKKHMPWLVSPKGVHVYLPSAGLSGSAGLLRNHGIKNAQGEWLCFVDDDDYLSPHYLEHLQQHARDYPRVDVIVFRMKDPKLGILPDPVLPEIDFSKVGTSFAIKREWMTGEDPPFQFIREDVAAKVHEDWQLLSELKEAQLKFYISPHVDYFVREATP
jgi:hypothetical protein